jgi:hypothetical protein
MSSRYKQAYSDEWFVIPRSGMDIACCSCNLVHDVKVRLKGKHIEARFAPDARKTSALRRRPKK